MAAKGGGKGREERGPVYPDKDMLQDLCTRFVLNCPAEELESEERIMFLVEEARRLRVYGLRSLLTRLGQAHWFYEDFCRDGPEGGNLKSFTLREFAALIFAQHPSLDRHKARVLSKQA